MPQWTPERQWLDKDVFIIGGGSSLADFDWSLLKNELTIGCNSAYRLGADVCKICLIGDKACFEHHLKNLEEYAESGGVVVTCCSQLLKSPISWLKTMPRKFGTILKEGGLVWHGNTGGAAVNLALQLGAKKVYLLGFDMELKDGRANWHKDILSKPNPWIYHSFIGGFAIMKAAMPKVFPDSEIINLTDSSKLDIFPKISVKQFFEERANNEKVVS